MTAKIGMRALGVALLGAVAIAAAPADAQQSATCGEPATDAERIACLEARVRALEEALSREQDRETDPSSTVTAAPAAAAADAPSAAATPVVEEAAVEEAAPSAPVEATAAARNAAPVEEAAAPAAEAAAAASEAAASAAAVTTASEAAEAGRGRRWLRLPDIPFIGGDGARENEAGAAPASEPLAAAAAEAAVVDPDSFGAEQVAARAGDRDLARRRDDDAVLRATIVDFEELHRGRLVVALDNGQMWRQLDVDTRKVRLEPGEPVGVEIWRSGFGGYRMKIGDSRRIMSVERLR